MAVLVPIRIPDPQNVLDTFGAGAVTRVERDTVTTFATASEITTIAVVAGTTEHEYRDATGVPGTHVYRWRWSAASPSTAAEYSGYSPTFVPGAGGQWVNLETFRAIWAGISDTADDGWLAPAIDAVNRELTRRVGIFLGPSPDAVRTFDGNGRSTLWIPGGIRAFTTIEIKDSTDDTTWSTVTSGDIVLRPHAWELGPGEPYPRLELIDTPAGSYSEFPKGFDNIRVTGTAFETFGWESPPEDVVQLGHTILSRIMRYREAGTVTLDTARTVSAFIYPDDAAMLREYRRLYFPGVA